MERLQRILAARGVSSRRAAEDLIKSGRVNVDGVVVTELGSKADPIRSVIKVDGKILKPQRPRYILMNKPRGYITTVKDERDRRTVMDLITIPERVYPVGRLDRDTEGLLLLTNDGDVANRVMHPRYELDKEYQVLTLSRPTDDTIQRLRDGIVIEGKRIIPEEVRVVRETHEGLIIKIVVHEGLNHLVRRMMDAVGIPVERLRRIRVGPLTITGVQLSSWRELTTGELRGLLEALHLDRAEDPDFAPRTIRAVEPAKKSPQKSTKRGGYGPKSPKRQQMQEDPLDLLDVNSQPRRDPSSRDGRQSPRPTAGGRNDRTTYRFDPRADQSVDRTFETQQRGPVQEQRRDEARPSYDGTRDRRYSPPDDVRRRQSDRPAGPPRRSESYRNAPEFDRNTERSQFEDRQYPSREDQFSGDRPPQRDPFQRPSVDKRGQRPERVNTGPPEQTTGRRSRQRPTGGRGDVSRPSSNRPDHSRPDNRPPQGSAYRPDGERSRPPQDRGERNDRPYQNRDTRQAPGNDRGYRGPVARRDDVRQESRDDRPTQRPPHQTGSFGESRRPDDQRNPDRRFENERPRSYNADRRPDAPQRPERSGGAREQTYSQNRQYEQQGPRRPGNYASDDRQRGPARPPSNRDDTRRYADRGGPDDRAPRAPQRGVYGRNQPPYPQRNRHEGSERGQARDHEQGFTSQGDSDRRTGGGGQDNSGTRPRRPGGSDLS